MCELNYRNTNRKIISFVIRVLEKIRLFNEIKNATKGDSKVFTNSSRTRSIVSWQPQCQHRTGVLQAEKCREPTKRRRNLYLESLSSRKSRDFRGRIKNQWIEPARSLAGSLRLYSCRSAWEPSRRLLLFLVRVVDRLDYLLKSDVFEKLREQIPHLDSRTPMFVFDNRQRALYLVIIIGSVIFHQSECCVRGRTRCIQKTIASVQALVFTGSLRSPTRLSRLRLCSCLNAWKPARRLFGLVKCLLANFFKGYCVE